MSGITPLLDTLLHQVLGKRADVQPPRDLNQPVKPTSPTDAPRALHSDSRLDARATSLRGTHQAMPRTPEESAAPARQPGVPTTSTQTHLSGSGRTIADLLLHFPSPPSVLSARTPLVSPGQPLEAGHVAHRLENSIRDSGLFYESHLSRWYKGEMPRQQLEREPQMWRVLRFFPAADASNPQAPQRPSPLATHSLLPRHSLQAATTGPPTASPSPPADKPAMPATPATPATPTMPTTPATPTASLAAKNPSMSRGDSHETIATRHPPAAAQDTIHESLQGIVRHQLEMLVTPALRWEGDAWSGLFMALLIHPPAERQASSDDSQDDTPDDDSQRTWRSDIDLDLQGAGRIKASVWMQASRLELDMHIADSAILEHLQTQLPVLRTRLKGHGFEEAGIRLTHLLEEAPDAHP